VRSFFSALRFLTLFPVPSSWCGDKDNLRKSLFSFPLIGLVIGGIVAGIGFGLGHVLPALPASVFVVVALVAASRGLHLDGLADTADGFFSSRSRERILEIMRDSRTGAMGVVAIATVLLLKVSLLAAAGGPLEWGLVLLMPLAGRCALLVVTAFFPYARPEGGLATVFRGGRGRLALLALWACVVLFAAGWLIESRKGLAAAGASIAVALLFGVYSWRKVGGYTGDTLGATCEIVELVPALVYATWA